jgi:hypothetical protein
MFRMAVWWRSRRSGRSLIRCALWLRHWTRYWCLYFIVHVTTCRVGKNFICDVRCLRYSFTVCSLYFWKVFRLVRMVRKLNFSIRFLASFQRGVSRDLEGVVVVSHDVLVVQYLKAT